MPSWKPLEFNHEYEALVTKKGPHSSEDSLRILEYLRVQKVFQPDVVMLHGSKLLSISSSDAKVSKTYGDEVWALHEQVCIAALHLGMMAWSAHCVEKLLAKFPASIIIIIVFFANLLMLSGILLMLSVYCVLNILFAFSVCTIVWDMSRACLQ